MRFRLRLLIAALAALAALPASATTYYFCAITNYYTGDLIYFTPIMSTSVEDVDEDKTKMAYYDEVEDQLSRDFPGVAGSFQPQCAASSKLSYLQRSWNGLPTSYKGPCREVAFTHPPIPSQPVKDDGPVNAAIIIEDTGPTPEQKAQAAAQAKAQAENARQVARENAERAAEVATKNAAYDAKWGPILEAERERRRKCPACQ
jgi:hypothetical protein